VTKKDAYADNWLIHPIHTSYAMGHSGETQHPTLSGMGNEYRLRGMTLLFCYSVANSYKQLNLHLYWRVGVSRPHAAISACRLSGL